MAASRKSKLPLNGEDSPFQLEVGFASLGFALVGLLADQRKAARRARPPKRDGGREQAQHEKRQREVAEDGMR